MDFYQRKKILNSNIIMFLREREHGSQRSWSDFCRSQALELGVSNKMIASSLRTVEPRLDVKNGELVKAES